MTLLTIIKFKMNIFSKTAVLFLSAIFLFSCTKEDLSRSGKLSFYNSVNKNSFSFIISNDFSRKNQESKSSKDHSKMTIAEVKLLSKFLKNNNYCINKNGNISFVIISRQEKIYDVTFFSLIEQNYNAKPIIPITYFGECS